MFQLRQHDLSRLQVLVLAALLNLGQFARADESKLKQPPGKTGAEEQPKTKSDTPNTVQTGAAPHFVGREKDGGIWSDLPAPDASWSSASAQKDRKVIWKLSEQEQNELLRTRANTGSMIGSFYELNNLLYCSREPFLMTPSVSVSKKRLQTVHAKDYKPTEAELFETMARQTGTSIKYDPTYFSKWIAIPPAMPIPYTLELADAWTIEDRDLYMAYIPKQQPFGMDIYIMGRYSGLTPEKTRQYRNENALRFSKRLSPSIEIKDMKEVKIDKCEALYCEIKPPKRPEGMWRQWSLIKNGEAFIIVSALENENASQLLPQVQEMVASFHVSDPPPSSPGL